MFDEIKSSTNAACVIVVPFRTGQQVTKHKRTPQARLEEALGLAAAINLQPRQSFLVPLVSPKPATLIGSGKVEEIASAVQTFSAELVIVDSTLSPVQQRNLEKAFKAKVIDRTGLILEIFGARAQTREGNLQVELAHLTYQKSRLVRSWTHLERQRGGFGFMGGPGETQIETDRRLIQERITKLKKELDQVVRTRQLHRENRDRVPYPTVALVGYTNAGKSTLFNRLTGADVFAKDLLFATLDPTLRRIKLPKGSEIILSDTVGFISDLPTQLIAAFRATLEEVLSAKCILHVRDISHDESDLQNEDVKKTLQELAPNEWQIPIIEIWNKADQLDHDIKMQLIQQIERSAENHKPILCSALTGEGCDHIISAIEMFMAQDKNFIEIELPHEDQKNITWLYQNGEVLERHELENTVTLKVRLSEKAANQASKKFNL